MLQNSLAVNSCDHSWLLRIYFRFSGGVFAPLRRSPPLPLPRKSDRRTDE